jgi:hypothetical protein
LSDPERAGVLGQAGEAGAERGLDIEAVVASAEGAVHLGQQGGARHARILPALGNVQVGQNHLRILPQRQGDGVFEAELERCGILRQGGRRQRQDDQSEAIHPSREHDPFSPTGLHVPGQTMG